MEKAKSQTFKCELCDQVLKTKDKLQRHFDIVHNTNVTLVRNYLNFGKV